MKANFNIEGADFLDTLLLRHHITLKTVYDFAAKQYDDLNTMERIIDLKEEEDVRRFLATARILNPENADSLIENLRKEARKQENRSWIANIQEPPVESYAPLIISAFVYNTPFFAMALKKCELLQQPVWRSEKQKDNSRILPFKKHFTKTGGSSYRTEYKAASPAVPGFREFGIPLEIEEGELKFLGARFDDHYLQLSFHPKAELPENGVIEARVIVAGNARNLRLYKNDGIFISAPEDGKGLDYTKGVEIESLEFVEETYDNE